MNKRATSTQPNPSPRSSTQQSVKNAPEVLEEEPKVGKWLDCRARIKSKELAPIHSVENGKNACSTSPRMDAGLGKSALMRIARLMNSLAKGPKNGDISAVAMLKKHEHHCGTVRPFVYDHSSKTRPLG